MKLMELYQDKIVGAIRGLDRIRFRGTLRWLATRRGLGTFMNHTGILLKDFSGWVKGLTARIRDSAQALDLDSADKAIFPAFLPSFLASQMRMPLRFLGVLQRNPLFIIGG